MRRVVRWMAVVGVAVACGGESKTAAPQAPRQRQVPGASGRGGSSFETTGAAGETASGGVSPDAASGSAGTRQSAGTGNRSRGGATSGGAKAGRGGFAGSGGEAVVECVAGESGTGADSFCWNGEESTSCGDLDCVSDCASTATVQGDADGCDIRCPPEAPVPLRDCLQRCGRRYDPIASCGAGLFCSRDSFTFSRGVDITDVCNVVPDSCPEPGPYEWVCARDGNVYPSLCQAWRARTDLLTYADDRRCQAPRDDLFQCGGIFCRVGIDSCHIDCCPDDHIPAEYSCVPSPGAGGAGDESGAGAGGS